MISADSNLKLETVIAFILLIFLVSCGGGGGGNPSATDKPLNPGIGKLPNDPPDITDPVNPIPDGIISITGYYVPTKLIGKWTTIVDTREILFNFKSGGACDIEQVYYPLKQTLYNCKWGMVDANNKQFLLIEYPGFGWYSYQYEKGFGNNFRITGGDLNAKSQLYSLAVPGTREGLFLGRWFSAGQWDFFVESSNILSGYKQIIDFKPDKSMSVETYRSVDNLTIAVREGSWAVTPTQLTYTLIDESSVIDNAPYLPGPAITVYTPASGDYPLTEVSMNSFVPEGMAANILYKNFARRSSYLYRDDRFVGHYTGPSTTLIISKIDSVNYNFELNYEGSKVNWTGQDLNGQLVVSLPPKFQEQGIVTAVFSASFNGINVVSATPTISAFLPAGLTKMSETKADFPTTIIGGGWQEQSKYGYSTQHYTLLPDGQFLSYDGTIQDEGTYTLTGTNTAGQITIDPVCAAPFFYDYALVDDQWVLRVKNTVGEDTFRVFHYEAGTQEIVDLQTLQYNSNQAIENAKWKPLFTLGPIDSAYSPIPAAVTDTGLIFVTPDPTPLEVHTGKQVFATDQVYTWRMPSLYCLGSGVAGCNSGYFQFYRNGRVLYYSKTVWGIEEFVGAPIGNATHAWGSYHIEDNFIVISNSLKIPLLKGYRKLRFGEFCYSNLNWTSGAVKPEN